MSDRKKCHYRLRLDETYICNIDDSNLGSEQVHLEGLLPVRYQLKDGQQKIKKTGAGLKIVYQTL